MQESESGGDNLHVGRNPQRFAFCLSHSPWGDSLLTHTCTHTHLCTQSAIIFYSLPPLSSRRGGSLPSSVLLIDDARADGCLGEAGPDQGCGLRYHVSTFAYMLARGFTVSLSPSMTVRADPAVTGRLRIAHAPREGRDRHSGVVT